MTPNSAAQAPYGDVVAVFDQSGRQFARVRISTAIACARCEAGKGCGAGILGGGGRIREIDAELAPGLSVAVGDTVDIAMQSTRLLQAAVIAYGYPLAAGLSGAGVAMAFGADDAVAAAVTLPSLLCGYFVAKLRLATGRCAEGMTPLITGRSVTSDRLSAS